MSDTNAPIIHELSAVTAAAHRIFMQAYGPVPGEIRADVSRMTEANGADQRWVAIELSADDLEAPVDDLIDRHILPAATMLAGDVPPGRFFGALDIPSGAHACRCDGDGISLRVIAAYVRRPVTDEVTGEVIGLGNEIPVLRLDVLTVGGIAA